MDYEYIQMVEYYYTSLIVVMLSEVSNIIIPYSYDNFIIDFFFCYMHAYTIFLLAQQ